MAPPPTTNAGAAAAAATTKLQPTARCHSARQMSHRAKRVEAVVVAAAITRTTPEPPRLSPPPSAVAASLSNTTIAEALMPQQGQNAGAAGKTDPMTTLHERVAAEVAARDKAAKAKKTKETKNPAELAIKHTTKMEMLRMLKVRSIVCACAGVWMCSHTRIAHDRSQSLLSFKAQAAWMEIITRRKEVRSLRAAVASLSREVNALRKEAASAADIDTAHAHSLERGRDRFPPSPAVSVKATPMALNKNDDDKVRSASPSCWQSDSVGMVNADTFNPTTAATVAPAGLAPRTKASGGSGDLDLFLDGLLQDGWSEERAALIDAAAAEAPMPAASAH